MGRLYSDQSPDFQHHDARGDLTQLVHEGYSQVNFVTTKAGSFRGGHYHKHNRELFYIIRGEVEVTLETEEESQRAAFSDGGMFSIPPCVKHSFTYIKDTEMITMYDCGVELGSGKMDIYEDWS